MTSSDEEPRTPFRDWPAAGRWVVYGVVALVVVLIAGFAGTAAVVRRSFPTTDGTVQLTRLTDTAEVRRDDRGVPHVLASDARDLFLAQGYAQAQDRFFAMDVARHRASGRLAEMLGRSALDSDLTARTLGWRQLAEEEYGELAETTRSYLRAFSAGVNAYLRSHSTSRLSLEYSLLELAGLNYEPDPWSAADSLAILKADGSDWQRDVRTEVDRARLAVDRSRAQVDALYPEVRDRTDAFVIPGARTASGRPVLANALPVVPGTPSPWIQTGLRCREITATCGFDVTGATLAGVPGVLVGHNAAVAWGLSRSDADVADLFLEEIDGDRYLRGKRWRELAERDELIRIEGEEPRTLTVRTTQAGPLLSDVSGEVSSVGANAAVPDGSPERGNGYAVALASTALAPARTADGLFALALADSAEDVRAAAGLLALPGHDLVYAGSDDATGRIVLGPLPLRAQGRTGSDPVPAWRRGGWPGTGPGEQAETDPVDGIIGSDRIRALVEDRDDWTAVGAAGIQADTRNPVAAALVPRLLRVLVPSRYYAEGQRLLADWDYRQAPDSAAALYFNVVWENLLRLTFHDQLRESLWPDGGTRWMAVVRSLLAEPENPWWDDVDTDDVVEDRDVILGQAIRDARDEITRTVSRDTEGWSWDALLRVRLDNGPLGDRDLGPLSGLLDRGPFGVGGGPGTPAGTTYDASRSFELTSAPGIRIVADLGDPDASRWVSMTGASGHAFARHFRDQFGRWVAGGSYPWRFTAGAVERSGDHLLRLEPAGSGPGD